MPTISSPQPAQTPRSPLMWIYAVVASAVFAAIAVLAHLQAYFFFDLPATRWLQGFRSPAVDAVMRAISWPGYPPQWLLMFAVVALGLFLVGWKFEILVVALAELGVGETGFLLKPLVDRHRPSASLVWVGDHIKGDPYTFTAGHVHTAVVLFGWVAYLLLTRVKPRSAYRRWLVPLSILFVVLTAISRVYMGDHWLSDVLGGFLLGSIWLALEILYYEHLAASTRRAATRARRSLAARMKRMQPARRHA